MDISILDTKDYIAAKRSVFAVSGVLLFASQIDSELVELEGQLEVVAAIGIVATQPLRILTIVLMAFLVVRAFEVRLPIRKIIPEFMVGLCGAIAFGAIALLVSA
jgi:hypothetical protein